MALQSHISIVLITCLLTLLPGSAHALDDTMFWSTITTEWGSAAGPATVTMLKADVTCDGQDDYIGSRVNPDNESGPHFEILYMTDHGGEFYIENLSLPYEGATQQYGVCGDPLKDPAPAVSGETAHEPGELAAMMDSIGLPHLTLCPTPLVINDGLCDAVRFYWAPEGTPGESRIIFHRN